MSPWRLSAWPWWITCSCTIISDSCVVWFLSFTLFSNLTCFIVLHIISIISTWLSNIIICNRNAMLFILTLYHIVVPFENWYNIAIPYRLLFYYGLTVLYIPKSVLVYGLFLDCDCFSFGIAISLWLQLLLLYIYDSCLLYQSSN